MSSFDEIFIILLKSGMILNITWSSIEPSAGPTLFKASSKISSLLSVSSFKISTSKIPKTGRWSDCLSSALPYQNTTPASGLLPSNGQSFGSLDMELKFLFFHNIRSVQAGILAFSDVS